MGYNRLFIKIFLLAAVYWTASSDYKPRILTRLMARCMRNRQHYKLLTNGNVKKCLRYEETMKPYVEAKRICEEEGSFVATFRTKMEQQIILNELYRGFTEHPKVVWIGLDRLEDYKTFKWIDNGETMSAQATILVRES
ncbi:uncharacterized protein LOC106080161 isoform X2 [Biomphalaria glabrata]|uniref:Uncharacterized protein LOC106080161 isoform X2 n=1 Tax=Biomphalaria glabrata TaxID=6526 RepID=A0A9W3B842_BIOGL|nr:uncharacterized protein LOC106080161 isoform X2 [Biomphalaria glabrata]